MSAPDQPPSRQPQLRRGRGRRLHVAPRRDVGRDPDYRFTLANERTFLAWIRTALALMAGGLVLVQFAPEMVVPHGREVLGGSLVALGTGVTLAAFLRWLRVEEAMRTGAPLPVSRLPMVLVVGVVLAALLATVGYVFGEGP